MTRFDRTGPIAVVAVSNEGLALGEALLAPLRRAANREEVALWSPRPTVPGGRAHQGSLVEFIGTLWGTHAGIVGVMASGIMVRAVAPWVESKLSDPAVVVLDEAGRFIISLLSGHEGGANRLAELVAGLIGGVPVVTTGTEARRRVVVGVGARRGVSADRVLAAIDQALAGAGCSRSDIRGLSTIDLKADEAGLLEAADRLGVPLFVVSRSRIGALQEALREPNFVEATTGVAAVCIPAVLLTGPETELLGPRTVREGVTVALARDVCGSSASGRVDESI